MGLAKPLRNADAVFFNESPDELVRDLTKFLDIDHAKYKHIYNS